MKLPQLETPKPKNKMKTFNWTKLPVNKIFGKNNIWTKVAKTFEKEKATPIGKGDHTLSQNLLCIHTLSQNLLHAHTVPKFTHTVHTDSKFITHTHCPKMKTTLSQK